MMAGAPMDHSRITAIITDNGRLAYGTGISPNPFSANQNEWARRHRHAGLRKQITDKIEALFEPRFITPPETSECIEAIVTMTDSRNILELGTCTGFSALHILRAIVGKSGAKLTCVECRPAHDRTFFSTPEIAPYFEFIEESTPQGLQKLHGKMFDLVFVDSDHSVGHCEKELLALWPITRTGTVLLFHDCPERQDPRAEKKGVIWQWLHDKVAEGKLRGTCLPSCEQMDCLAAFGPGYPKQCNPGLGIFIRQ
jgi:predicted O-methyltransferase YrrM